MQKTRLINLRESKDWTQARMARELNIPRSTYNAYENGINEPDVEMIIKIAKLFHISVDYLIGYDFIEIDYRLPKEIKNIQDAIGFIKNLSLFTQNKNDKEILEFAKVIFYIANKF